MNTILMCNWCKYIYIFYSIKTPKLALNSLDTYFKLLLLNILYEEKKLYFILLTWIENSYLKKKNFIL